VTRSATRLLIGGLLLVVAVGTMVSAAVVGAATAPVPDIDAPGPGRAGVNEEAPDSAPAPRRFVATGVVVGVRPDRLSVRSPARDEAFAVALRPVTVVRINMRRAALADIRAGDHVVVVGRPNAGGVLMARAIAVVRRPAAASL
jgi:hypothetical protein